MTTWLVSRHSGAVEWLAAHGYADARHVTHLELDEIRPGDVIVGTLPVHLIAQACARGARYFNLSLDVPEAWRGRELSVAELEACGARLEEYQVRSVNAPKPVQGIEDSP
ncbi:CRISPR-associated protein Csx16 [Fontimonas thermophila]|uniref:CRISPR-associated protein Csx16 n=1 Tax=Fontimonas thermophila TaxID=1076937 RepID=A0A1I2IYK1_9GAMM|nr:CRISPR-associated protein Csx16 [Fontimonas thermophila]SFF47515.1 CRISPR-associated protein Csx16 [Fontimonas thermophila]